MDQPAVKKYINLFEHRIQSGGGGAEYPVFEGARFYQNGSGFGDILRGIFRFILPVAASTAQTFLGETMRARDAGADWGAAAKSAIAPTASTALNNTVQQIANRQSGKGKRRKITSKKYKKAKTPKVDYTNWNF